MTQDTTTGPGVLRTTSLPEADLHERGYIPPPSSVAATGRPAPGSRPSAPAGRPTLPGPAMPTTRPTPVPDHQKGYIPPKQPAPKPADPKP